MIYFLAAQAADPLDPAPLLIQADWLEEHGDLAGAGVLRGMVRAGIPSLIALAFQATFASLPYRPDDFKATAWWAGGEGGAGHGGGDGVGSGDTYGERGGAGDGRLEAGGVALFGSGGDGSGDGVGYIALRWSTTRIEAGEGSGNTDGYEYHCGGGQGPGAGDGIDETFESIPVEE